MNTIQTCKKSSKYIYCTLGQVTTIQVYKIEILQIDKTENMKYLRE